MKLPGILLLSAFLVACGGGSGGSSDSETPDTSNGNQTPTDDNTNDQTQTDQPLTREELVAIAMPKLEATYGTPEEFNTTYYKNISDGLQLSTTDLTGTWVKITQEKRCFSEANCTIDFSRRIMHLVDDPNQYLASSCRDEPIFENDEGGLEYQFHSSDGMHGPTEIEKISHSHLRSRIKTSLFSSEAITDFYKLSDSNLSMGSFTTTQTPESGSSTEFTHEIECYIEDATALYNHKTKETNYYLYGKIANRYTGFIRAANVGTDDMSLEYSPNPLSPNRLLDKKPLEQHTFTLEKSIWTATGTLDYSYDTGTVVGTISFAITEFNTPAE